MTCTALGEESSWKSGHVVCICSFEIIQLLLSGWHLVQIPHRVITSPCSSNKQVKISAAFCCFYCMNLFQFSAFYLWYSTWFHVFICWKQEHRLSKRKQTLPFCVSLNWILFKMPVTSSRLIVPAPPHIRGQWRKNEVFNDITLWDLTSCFGKRNVSPWQQHSQSHCGTVLDCEFLKWKFYPATISVKMCHILLRGN